MLATALALSLSRARSPPPRLACPRSLSLCSLLEQVLIAHAVLLSRALSPSLSLLSLSLVLSLSVLRNPGSREIVLFARGHEFSPFKSAQPGNQSFCRQEQIRGRERESERESDWSFACATIARVQSERDGVTGAGREGGREGGMEVESNRLARKHGELASTEYVRKRDGENTAQQRSRTSASVSSWSSSWKSESGKARSLAVAPCCCTCCTGDEHAPLAGLLGPLLLTASLGTLKPETTPTTAVKTLANSALPLMPSAPSHRPRLICKR